MPFDNRHAPLDSPHLTGEPTAPSPGVNDNSSRIATTAFVQAVARKPTPTSQATTLTGDLAGRGTTTINATVIGVHGRHITTDVPADTEVYVWSQAAYAWELIPACQLGQQSEGEDLVQVSDGAGGFNGHVTDVVAGTYPAANVTVDHYGIIQGISSGILDPSVIPDAPSDGFSWGRINGAWGHVAPLNSPALTGNPTAPTPAMGDNDSSIATTSFVQAEISAAVIAAGGSGIPEAPSDGSYYGRHNLGWSAVAPLDSPVFIGNPTAPTAGVADNDTTIATTAYVKSQNYLVDNNPITISGDASGTGTTAIPLTLANVNSGIGTFAVQTVNAKGLTVNAQNLSGDISTVGATATLATVVTAGTVSGISFDAKGRITAATDQGYLTPAAAAATYAPIASPLFTGDPRGPTPASGDNDTSLATTAFVKNQNYITGNQTVTLSGDVTGAGNTAISATVERLRGRVVAATAPLDTQVLAWSAGTSQWQPTTPSPGSGVPAGADTQVQFNNAGTMNGSAGATFTASSLTSMNINLPGSATGDIWYRASTGALTRLAPGSAGTILQIASGLPSWQTVATGSGTVSPGGVGPQIAQYPSGTSNVVAGVTLSGDATIAQGGALTLANSGVAAGTYQGIQFDAKGRAISATNQGYLTPASAAATFAPISSPSFAGDPTAPTPAAGDNDTSIATTAFVTAALSVSLAGLAPLASPVFTGNPTAPTPAPGDADTSIATTAFVANSFLLSSTAASTYAPIANPIFTGDPRAPTPGTADNDTSIATTAFVKAQAYLTGNQTITMSGDVTGTGTTGIPATVIALQTRSVAATAPNDSDVLGWNQGLTRWEPRAVGSIGLIGLNLTSTGTNAATALALSSDFNEVLTIAAGTGVLLPAFMNVAARRCLIAAYDSTSQEDLLIYPLATQTFFYGGVSNGLGQPLTLQAGNIAQFIAVSPTKVYMMVFA